MQSSPNLGLDLNFDPGELNDLNTLLGMSPPTQTRQEPRQRRVHDDPDMIDLSQMNMDEAINQPRQSAHRRPRANAPEGANPSPVGGERRRRTEMRSHRTVYKRDYVQGRDQDYIWDADKEGQFTGERTTADKQVPEYIAKRINQWRSNSNPRMYRNHQFYKNQLVGKVREDVPTLFRKFYEYAQDKWIGRDAGGNIVPYSVYCGQERNRPEDSAVWDELKKIIRLWDQQNYHNRHRTASINKVDFCSIIW